MKQILARPASIRSQASLAPAAPAGDPLGADWTEAASSGVPVLFTNSSTVFKGQVFGVFFCNQGGNCFIPYTSPDGVVWNKGVSIGNPGTGASFASAALGDVLCVFGTATGLTYNASFVSPDGQNFSGRVATEIPAGRGYPTLLAFNNKFWLIAGKYPEVWSSADGLNWTLETNQAPFGFLSAQAGVTFNNRMWVIGGELAGGIPTADVWSSADGVNWRLEAGTPGFTPRFWHSAVAFQSRIWVIGGAAGNSLSSVVPANDVWSSPDGVTWTQVTNNATFPPRFFANSVVFQNKMWEISGFGAGVFHDSWFSPQACQSVPTPVFTPYKQSGQTWSPQHMPLATSANPAGPKTISQIGCFLTCLSMIDGRDPGVLNKLFTNQGDYSGVEGDLNRDDTADDIHLDLNDPIAFPDSSIEAITFQMLHDKFVAIKLEKIEVSRCRTHFVLAIGVEINSKTGQCDIKIQDPATRDFKFLDDYVASGWTLDDSLGYN